MKMMVVFLVHIMFQEYSLFWLIFSDIYNLTFTQPFCGNIGYFKCVLRNCFVLFQGWVFLKHVKVFLQIRKVPLNIFLPF